MPRFVVCVLTCLIFLHKIRSLLFSLTGEGETIRIKLSRNFYASCAYICIINPGGMFHYGTLYVEYTCIVL